MKKLYSFTLIELLIVIVIIGILAVALVPRLTGAQASARDVARIAHIRQVQAALTAYHADHGEYPGGGLANTAGCGNSVRTGVLAPLVTGGYISSIPLDPKYDPNNSFCYHYNASRTSISGRQCNGQSRSNYEYSIFFTLEKPRSNIYKVTAMHTNTFNHCIVGDARVP